MSKSGVIGGVLVAIVLIVCLVLGIICTEKIPAGYVGVVYNMNGGVDGEVLTQGWHMVAPTKKVTEYSIGIEQSYLTAGENGDSPDDESFEVPSSDGKGLKVDLTFTYRYDIDKVSETFTRFKGQSGKDILKSFIKPNIISWTKEVTARYPVEEMLAEKRVDLNNELSNYLADKFAQYGIIIENATLIDINPDDTTREAIQAKIDAQYKQAETVIAAETAKIEAERDKEVALIEAQKKQDAAKIEAEAKIAIAESEAEAARIKAESDAEVTRIKAEAEAKANKEIAASLTPEFIEKIKYEQWDGALPNVTGANSIIGVEDIVGEK